MRFMYDANIHLKEENFDAVIQDIKTAIDTYPVKENPAGRLTPDDRDFFICAHYNLGAAYARKARTLKENTPDYKDLFKLALTEYEKILDYNPNDAEAHNNIGACREALGDLDGSIKSRMESLDNKNDYPESYVNLGISLAKQKKYDEAIQQFTNAIEIREDYAEAYYSRALEYAHTNRKQEAISDYDNAIKYKKNYHSAYLNCGILYSDMGNYKKAISYFINALAYSDDNEAQAKAHNSLAISLAKIDKKEEALIHFQEALKLSNNPDFKKRVENNIRITI